MEGDVLEAVLLEFVVRLQDAPDRQNVTSGKVEDRRLVVPPSIGLCVSETPGVEHAHAAEFRHEVPACPKQDSRQHTTREARVAGLRTILGFSSFEQKSPGCVMDFVAAQALGIPIVPHPLDERVDQSPLVFDDVNVIVRDAHNAERMFIPDGDDSDVRILGSAVRVQVFVVGLKAVKDGLDSVVLRIGEKRTARVDCTEA